MFDIEEFRSHFPMLKTKMNDLDLVYLDNANTALKPQVVIDEVVNYYTNLTTNAHRGDSTLSFQLDDKYEHARNVVANFINAKSKDEIIFNSGTTHGINQVAFGFVKPRLKKGDTILLAESEHASNILPWMIISQEAEAQIRFIPLDESGRITIDNVAKCLDESVKFISLAHVSNVLGYITPMQDIITLAHKHNIIVVVDGAQSVSHLPCDVQALDADFLAFSSHKLCGPSGVGVLYGKMEHLMEMTPLEYGGGMNARFDMGCNITLQKPSTRFEAGTPAIEGALGLAAAIEFLQSYGMENLHNYELELKKYAVEKLSQIEGIEIYNAKSETGLVTFNKKGIFAQDLATHLNTYGIVVRSGQHCAKVLDQFLKTSATVRASISFYNTKSEIDLLVEACKSGGDFLDAFFK